MNRLIRTVAFISLVACACMCLESFPAVGFAQQINRLAYRVPGTRAKSEVFLNPRLSPGRGEWLSYEALEGDAHKQYVVHVTDGESFEVSAQPPQPSQSLEPGSRDRQAVYTGGLVWCPRMVAGWQWYVFVGSRDGNIDLYAGRVDRPDMALRLTSDEGIDDQPVWSPDGEKIAFTSRRSGGADVYVLHEMPELLRRLEQETEGNTAVAGDMLQSGRYLEQASADDREDLYPAWMPDGRAVVYTQAASAGEKWRSRLLVKYLRETKEVEIARDTLRIMRNVSVSPDGQWMAYYRSLGVKPGEAITMVLGQVQYAGGQVVRLKPKWPHGIRRFEDAEERIEGGPYWTAAGSLMFLNDKRGKRNVIYEIPGKELERLNDPQMIQNEFIAMKGEEYGIRGVTGRDSEWGLAFVAQVGEKFGLFWTQWQLMDTTRQVTPSAWIALGPAVYQYNGGETEASAGFGTLASVRLPLNAGGLSVAFSLEQGFLRGRTSDANGRLWEFLSPFYGLRMLLSQTVFRLGPLDVAPEAGAGLLYVKSTNATTQGARLFLPVGLSVYAHLGGAFGLVLGTHLNIAAGELTGLRTDRKTDRFLDARLGLALH